MTGDEKADAERLDREAAEREARSKEDLASSKFAGPVAEQQQAANAPEPVKDPSSDSADGLGSYPDHVKRIYDGKRKEIEDACAFDKDRELKATFPGMSAEEIERDFAPERQTIDDKFAKRQADQFERLEREELERLEKARRLYVRD